MDTLRIGIVLDDYKLFGFKRDLNKGGFTDFTVNRGPAVMTSVIIIIIDKNRFEELRKLCKKCNIDLKHSN
jgi:hypothetical protein